MKTIGIFYGSSTGNDGKGYAKRIAGEAWVWKTKIFMTYLTLLPLM